MRESVAGWLRCPRCHTDGSLTLHGWHGNAVEVREGTLVCANCDARHFVSEGIADLLCDPPDFVRREREGLARFAEVMRRQGWHRERILALPVSDDGYWYGQARSMSMLLDRVRPRPGARLVNIGSNTCWASNVFARHGLEVVALDIAPWDLQGLRTAEHFFACGDVYFERLLSTMFDVALASESVNYVFCCQVLHHNDVDHLRRTFTEMHRILRPGGLLMVVNEGLRFPLRLKHGFDAPVAEFDGNEHVHFLHDYVMAARRAGFHVEMPAWETVRHGSRRGPLALAYRAGRFAWRYVVRGDANLTMLCSKDAAPNGEGPALGRALVGTAND